MTGSATVKIDSVSHGWIELYLNDGVNSHTIVFSDVPNDGLDHLCSAIADISVDGLDGAQCELSLEPDFLTINLTMDRNTEIYSISMKYSGHNEQVFQISEWDLITQLLKSIKSIENEVWEKHWPGWDHPGHEVQRLLAIKWARKNSGNNDY